MTTTKADIVEQIHKTHPGMRKSQAQKIVATVLDLMKASLESGEDILLSGFGKFSVKNKTSRKGRNPQTGETLQLDARTVVTFKSSDRLKERVNEK